MEQVTTQHQQRQHKFLDHKSTITAEKKVEAFFLFVFQPKIKIPYHHHPSARQYPCHHLFDWSDGEYQPL
jgi:quercetin dioxygenase-like cupin family protein